MEALRELGMEVKIWKMPVEIPDPILSIRMSNMLLTIVNT